MKKKYLEEKTMFILKSEKFENIIVALSENYEADIMEGPMVEFTDPYFDGKKIAVIPAEDDSVEEITENIRCTDPVQPDSHPSLLHQVAVEFMVELTTMTFEEIITGQHYDSDDIASLYENDFGIASDIWEHAVREAKARVITMLGR